MKFITINIVLASLLLAVTLSAFSDGKSVLTREEFETSCIESAAFDSEAENFENTLNAVSQHEIDSSTAEMIFSETKIAYENGSTCLRHLLLESRALVAIFEKDWHGVVGYLDLLKPIVESIKTDELEYDTLSARALYTYHTLSGILAIEKGNVENAKMQLELSTKASNNFYYSNFDPDFDLALALLKLNKFKVVAQYLEIFKSVKERDKEKYQTWIGEINNRQIPKGMIAKYYP